MATALLKTSEFQDCRITIDEAKCAVNFQEDWQYNWRVQGLTNGKEELAKKLFYDIDPSQFDAPTFWTLAEKRAFHHKCDSIIWQNLSGNVKIAASGSSAFALRNRGKLFAMNFDIQWVLAGGHWHVDVIKVPDYYKKEMPEFVNMSARKIQLIHEVATAPRTLTSLGSKVASVPSVLHEFGHTIYNEDEYSHRHGRPRDECPSEFEADIHGIMNLGNELRNRYFSEVVVSMNTMIANTKFEIDHVL